MSDEQKIEELFENHDFPVYALCDDVFRNLEYHLGPSDWLKSDQIQKCSFCQEQVATRKNSHLDLFACESCFTDIESGEVDIVDPEDHPVSQVIHQLFCEAIQKNYFLVASYEAVFEEYEIKRNTCCVCQQTIMNGDVAISSDHSEIAHYECIKETGFPNYFTPEDFKEVIRDHFSDVFEN